MHYDYFIADDMLKDYMAMVYRLNTGEHMPRRRIRLTRLPMITQPPPQPAVNIPVSGPDPMLIRQAPLKLHIPKGVAVVGCGGVGSWVAMLLALAGVNNLWLFDPDLVSDHNLNRLPLPPSAIGESKSRALSTALMALRPSCKPVPMATFTQQIADEIYLYEEVSWIVCTTDTLVSRRSVYKWSAEVNYIECAAEGEIGSIAATPAEWATADETRPGYASVPVWVGPCIIAAQMAVAYILHNHHPYSDLIVRMGWEDGQFEFLRRGGRGVPLGDAHSVTYDDYDEDNEDTNEVA